MQDSNVFIKKLYTKYYFSAFIPLFLTTIALVVINNHIGRTLGPMALAAMSLLLPITMFYIAIGVLFGSGGSIAAARAIGRNDFDRAKKIYTSTFLIIAYMCAGIAAIAIPLITPIVQILGIPTEFVEDAERFCLISLLLGGSVAFNQLFLNFLRIEGKNDILIRVFCISPILSSIISWILIVKMNIGIYAAPIATMSGFIVMDVIFLIIMIRNAKILTFVPVSVKECLGFLKEIIASGAASASDEACVFFRTPIINVFILTTFGELALSAYGLQTVMVGLMMAVTSGSSAATVQLLGVFDAEHDTSSIKQIIQRSLIVGISVAMVCAAIYFIFAKNIALSFGLNTDETLKIAVPMFKMFAISLPIAVVSNTFISVHNTLNHPIIANTINILRNSVFLLIPMVLLGNKIGIIGVWHSIWISDLLTVLCAVGLSLYFSSKNKYLSKLFLIDREYSQQGKYISFSVDNSIEDILLNTSKISTFCEQNNLNKKRSMLIALSIEEMLTLIHDECLKNPSDKMNVRILIYKENIIIRVRSAGNKFNPIKYYEESMKGDLDIDSGLKLGNKLGLKMIVDTTKGVDYQETFGISNLTIWL